MLVAGRKSSAAHKEVMHAESTQDRWTVYQLNNRYASNPYSIVGVLLDGAWGWQGI
jgi:hypothetical protein